MKWDEMTEEERNRAICLFVLYQSHVEHAPPYTTDMNAAWKIVEYFRGQYDVHVGSAPLQYDVAILDRRVAGASFNASAKTAPEAICKAALQVAGRLDGEGRLLISETWQIRYLKGSESK